MWLFDLLFSGWLIHQDVPSNIIHSSVVYGQSAYLKLWSRPVSTEQVPVVGGVVPHHLLAAPQIAQFYQSLADLDPEIVVLVGPDHYNAGSHPLTTTLGGWKTPFGDYFTDPNLINILIRQGNLKIDEAIFNREHSIKTQLPWLKLAFPKAKIIPLVLQSGVTQPQIQTLADLLNKHLPAQTILIASVDFSHHATHLQAFNQDTATIAMLTNQDHFQIWNSAVDSPESLALLMAFSQKRRASHFQVLAQRDSSHFGAATDSADLTSYVTGVYTSKKP